MKNEQITTQTSQKETYPKKEKCLAFIRKHKTPILVASATATSLLLSFCFLCKSKKINSISISTQVFADKVVPAKDITTSSSSTFGRENLSIPTVTRPVYVREHVRNLPNNHKPSILKIEWAEQHGYSLKANQTIVNAHIKHAA